MDKERMERFVKDIREQRAKECETTGHFFGKANECIKCGSKMEEVFQ
ncbi:hypothetical protein ACNF40_06565 [Cuniculiplasma sp. SKW4]